MAPTESSKHCDRSTLPVADCHFHIVDRQRFPPVKGVGYQPRADESGTLEEFAVCMETHGITHGLAVQPSGYGFDNSALLDAVERSKGRLKGIAVVPMGIGKRELAGLADAGIVGVRFNLIDFDPAGLGGKGIQRLLQQVRDMNWFAEIQCKAAGFGQIIPLIRVSRVRVLIDHLGRPDPRSGPDETGFKKVLALADTGLAVVKLSGAFRESRRPYPYKDLDSFVHTLIDAYSLENCVWGSDWPFLNLDIRPLYQQTLSCLDRWLPDEVSRRKVLWETPARIFGFRETE